MLIYLWFRCQFYDRKSDIDHFISLDTGRGIYDTEYLKALFTNDLETIAQYEDHAAAKHGVGPSTSCTTIANFSTIRVNCGMWTINFLSV